MPSTSSESPLTIVSKPNPMQPLGFVTEPDSPWPDGYSLDGERAALADLIGHDDVEGDPRFDRLMELERREAAIVQSRANYARRKGADPLVTDRETESFDRIGDLVDDAPDTMELHTMEAFRLFMGRAADPDRNLYTIPGGKLQAAAMRTIWLMTRNNNPYAEWALLLYEQSQAQLEKLMDDEIALCQSKIVDSGKRGLTVGLVVSSRPQLVNLQFRSPYGYAVGGLIVKYDLMVRHLKTLSRKNLMKDDHVRTKIQGVTRQIRAAWLELLRFDRYLTRPELATLSRSDFLATADLDGTKRAQAAAEIFGPVPAEIFTGRARPQHSRRRGEISHQEQQLLLQTINALTEKLQQQVSEPPPAPPLGPGAA